MTEAETIISAESFIDDGCKQASLGLFEDAAKTYDKAIEACKSFRGDSSVVKKLAAQALGNKGAAIGDFGRNLEAVECYDAAIFIYQQLAKHNNNSTLMANQAISIMNKGWALINLGRDQEGFHCHHEALKIRRQLVSEGCEWVKSDVARSLYNVGRGYLKTERFAKALVALDEAVEILQSLMAAGDEGREEELAYVLGTRADTLMYLGRYQESLENCDEVCSLFTRLALSQNNPRFEKDLATALDAREGIRQKAKGKA